MISCFDIIFSDSFFSLNEKKISCVQSDSLCVELNNLLKEPQWNPNISGNERCRLKMTMPKEKFVKNLNLKGY